MNPDAPKAGSKFCKSFKEFASSDKLDGILGSDSTDSAAQLQQMKKAFDSLNDDIKALQKTVPSEIKSDFQAVAAVFERMSDQVQDMKSMDELMSLSAFKEMDSPEMQKSSDAVSNYVKQNCGYDPDSLD